MAAGRYDIPVKTIQLSDILIVMCQDKRSGEKLVPLRDEGRDVIKVCMKFADLDKPVCQAFYKSTGDNSKMKGTWFPFDGIIHKGKSSVFYKDNILYDGGLALARKGGELSNEDACNPAMNKRYLYCRLGNKYYAAMSYALGGRLWNGDNEYGNMIVREFGIDGEQYDLSTYIADGIDGADSIEAINRFVGTAISVNYNNPNFASKFAHPLFRDGYPLDLNNCFSKYDINGTVENRIMDRIFLNPTYYCNNPKEQAKIYK